MIKRIICSAILGYALLSENVNSQSTFRNLDDGNGNILLNNNFNDLRATNNRVIGTNQIWRTNSNSNIIKDQGIWGNNINIKIQPSLSKEQRDLIKLLDVMKDLIKNNPKLVESPIQTRLPQLRPQPIDNGVNIRPSQTAQKNYDYLRGFRGEQAKRIIELQNPTSTVRILRPGQVTTREYMFNRINILLDRNDIVDKIYYG